MEYFFYCRDRPGTSALRAEIVEAHWSFMDRYADAMIARGPTLAPDGTTATGSMHMVDLPDADAARVFAFDEPNYRAGVYGEVLVHRWRNESGRTMWDFAGDPDNNRRYLIIGHGRGRTTTTADNAGLDNAALDNAGLDNAALGDAYRRHLVDGGYLDRLIVWGPLLTDDGAEWVGSATLVELPERAAVDAMLARDPLVRAGLYGTVEVHDWRYGGRS